MTVSEPFQVISSDARRFASILGCRRIWAISSVHAEAARLESIHDAIRQRVRPRDGIVYLGNMIGRGASHRETLAELLEFRRFFIAREHALVTDHVFLRGSQEETWQRLMELQFAPNPAEVMRWMLDHGIAPVLAAYNADHRHALAACRDGAVAITRWTAAFRTAVNSAPGHSAFLTSLRRAAFSRGGELLFVNAGIDPSRPLDTQYDSFWWGGAGFTEMTSPYLGFRKAIRGFDRQHLGLQVADHAISIDRGCGFGGPLACACIELDGTIADSFEA